MSYSFPDYTSWELRSSNHIQLIKFWGTPVISVLLSYVLAGTVYTWVFQFHLLFCMYTDNLSVTQSRMFVWGTPDIVCVTLDGWSQNVHVIKSA